MLALLLAARLTAPAAEAPTAPSPAFSPPPPIQPGDWRAEHPEPGQSPATFIARDAHCPDAARRVVYLQPLGDFGADAPSLALLSEYVAAYLNLEVRLLPSAPAALFEANARINTWTKSPQLLTGDVLTWLRGRLPEDAFALVGVSTQDLYPGPDWNFVFGQATYSDGVGVFSFARHDPAFFGDPRGEGWREAQTRRSFQVVTHELGHMFGIRHCTAWSCAMAGSNSQAESDRQPLHLGPECLQKLHHCVSFDSAERYRRLAEVTAGAGLEDEAKWFAARAAALGG